jgi:predicted nucleic acid-binding protein
MAKQKVYLETSVISYLTARPSRDVVKLAKQELTRQWWRESAGCFDLYVSPPVMDEINAGNPDAAKQRLSAVDEFPVLEVNADILALYRHLLSAGIVPQKAAADAFHIAIAAYHGMSYLLTWNFKHINNAAMREKIASAVGKAGYTEAKTVTPEELWR